MEPLIKNNKVSNLSKSVCSLALLSLLFGCQGSIGAMIIANSYPNEPRNYKTAGFDSSAEVVGYADKYIYLASKISSDDWGAFYKKFPEYSRDIQNAKAITFFGDYNAGYTAYAFRWSMMNKKVKWDRATIERLKSKQVASGDDVYKIIFALGVPERILWDNDFDILIYKNNTAILLNDDKYTDAMKCIECTKLSNTRSQISNEVLYASTDDEVLKTLNLSRPSY